MGRFTADVMVCLWCCSEGGFLRAGGCHVPASSPEQQCVLGKAVSVGVSVVVFVTALSGARGPGPSAVLPCPALGAFPGSLPALALMLCSHGNGDARQVSQEHHGCMKHMHLLA